MRYSESRLGADGLKALLRQEGLSGKVVGGNRIRNARLGEESPIDDHEKSIENEVVIYRTPNGYDRLGTISELASSRFVDINQISEIYSRLKANETLVLNVSYGKKPNLFGISIEKKDKLGILPYV